MNQSKADKIRTNIENWTTTIFTVLGRLFITVLVLAVFTMVYKGLQWPLFNTSFSSAWRL